jgi:hypothetical protein
MAIGTTLTVGFDANAVREGFSGLGGMFSGAMRGFRQAGIGAARQVGARMTDMLGRVLMAVPEGIKETMDFAGDLDDMSQQTGMSVEKLVLLNEALRLSGAEASDTSMMISRFANNLGTAMRETGAAQDALHKLGFKVSEFKGMALDEAFEKIGIRAGEMSWGMGELESTMADLFGAKMGYKLIRFFKNFDSQSKQAERNVGALSRVMGKKASFYADMGDKIDRFKMKWTELMAIIIDVTNSLFGTDWIDKMFDSLNADKVRTFMIDVRDGFKIVMTEDFWRSIMGDFGRAIGDGIKASLGDAFSLKGMIPSWMGGGDATSSTGNNDKTIARMDRQIQLLQTIATKQGGWA